MKTRVIHQGFEPQRSIGRYYLRSLCPPAKRVVMIKNLMLIVTAMLLLAGCKYPEPAKVEQKDARPAIGISGAPEGALLYVDGLQMGYVSRYDGKEGVLLVESGKHLVEVRAPSGESLFVEEVFLSGSTTKIIHYNP